MNTSNILPTALAADDVAHADGGPAVTALPPSRPEAVARPAGWSVGRIAALTIGALLLLVGLTFLGSGGTALWADRTQRDAGYATTDAHAFSSAGSALATERTELGSTGTGWLYPPGLLGKVRIRVTPADPGAALFVGIGPSADVDRYLADVNHTVISDFWTDTMETVSGGASASAPEAQTFWVASAAGVGEQTLTWDPADGSWTVVVMNADGRPGIDVRADLGARVPALPWIGLGVLVAGVVFAAGGGLLIAGAVRCRDADRAMTA